MMGLASAAAAARVELATVSVHNTGDVSVNGDMWLAGAKARFYWYCGGWQKLDGGTVLAPTYGSDALGSYTERCTRFDAGVDLAIKDYGNDIRLRAACGCRLQ